MFSPVVSLSPPVSAGTEGSDWDEGCLPRPIDFAQNVNDFGGLLPGGSIFGTVYFGRVRALSDWRRP